MTMLSTRLSSKKVPNTMPEHVHRESTAVASLSPFAERSGGTGSVPRSPGFTSSGPRVFSDAAHRACTPSRRPGRLPDLCFLLEVLAKLLAGSRASRIPRCIPPRIASAWNSSTAWSTIAPMFVFDLAAMLRSISCVDLLTRIEWPFIDIAPVQR